MYQRVFAVSAIMPPNNTRMSSRVVTGNFCQGHYDAALEYVSKELPIGWGLIPGGRKTSPVAYRYEVINHSLGLGGYLYVTERHPTE